MTEVKLTFAIPFDIAERLNTFRYIVDHLLTLLGIASWRWEISNGAVKEIIRGPYTVAPPEVFKIDIPAAQRLSDSDLCNSVCVAEAVHRPVKG